jgi:glycosyltransferase involved in cell wall biosynthesis
MLNEPNRSCLISIIIATNNAEKDIAACLKSIEPHISLTLEVIVIDGGSQDETLSVLSGFSACKIKWISEPDQGIYDAFNKGVTMASGKWLYFLGSDDRLLSGFSELGSKLANENTIYYGNSKPFYGDRPPDPYGLLQGEFSPYRLAKYCMNHQSILYPAKTFKNYRYKLKYKVLADYALNIRLWGDAGYKREFHPIEIVSYNMGGFSSVHEDLAFARDKSKLIRKGMGLKLFIRYLFRRFKDRLKNRD